MNSVAAAAIVSSLDRELWVVTAQADARRGGLIATFVNPASIVPELPRMIVGLSHQHHTWELVERSRSFALHLLSERNIDWIERFGLQSGRDGDKLQGLRVRPGRTGSPILEDALAWLDCRVEERLDSGDRTIYLAEVVDAAMSHSASPLTFHQFIKRSSPDLLADLRRQLQHDGEADAAAIHQWRTVHNENVKDAKER